MDSVGIPRSTRDFRAHLRGAGIDRCGKSLFSRRVSLTRSQPGTSVASTPMRQTPTRGCSPLPVCTLTWKRGRGFCTDVVRPYLSFSPSLSRFLFHFSPLFLSVSPFPSLSLSFSRFLLFSLLLCQSARFRTAKEYLKRCIFRIISIHPHRIHPARGSIIHCTAR